MNGSERHDVLIVVHQSDGRAPQSMQATVRIPLDANLTQLMRELERESPEIYPEVRRRILRAAGGVLATGRAHPLTEDLTRQLARGGPIVFPALAEDPRSSSSVA